MSFLNSLFEQEPKIVFSDEEINALRERNASRLKEAKERLGTKYLLHPVNKVEKKHQPLSLLS